MAQWLATNGPFADPATLLVQPDHYVYRMLYSQGISLEDLEIGKPEIENPRKVWRIFASHYWLFRATPTRMWLDFAFEELFGLNVPLSEEMSEQPATALGRRPRGPRACPVGYGFIVDAFQVAYALGLLAAGRFVDKIGTRIGYMVIMAIWSLSAMGHALASTAMEFGIARFSLGLGESGNFPAAIKTVAEWFPQRERALATGIFNSAANLGAILAPLIVPWITIHYGWHSAFLVTGCFSALWIFWWYRNYRKPADHPTLTGAELRFIYQEAAAQMGPSVSWSRLLLYRQIWAFAMAKFLTDPIWWFYLFWLPSFFSAKFHLDLSHFGLPLIVVYNASAVGSIRCGWLPEAFRRFGDSQSYARLGAMFLCACMVLPIFTLIHPQSVWMSAGVLSLAAAGHQGWSANLFTTTSDMFPHTAVGSMTGIGGMAGSAGGAFIATYAGHILQLTHSYASLFLIAGSAYLVALAILQLLAPGLKKADLSI